MDSSYSKEGSKDRKEWVAEGEEKGAKVLGGEARLLNIRKYLPAGFKRQCSAVVRLVILPRLAGGGHVFRHDDAIPDRGILPPAGTCSRAGTERSIHHARWHENAETVVLTSSVFSFFFLECGSRSWRTTH